MFIYIVKVLCNALYGESLSVSSFPTVLNGQCSYTSYCDSAGDRNRVASEATLDGVHRVTLWGHSSHPYPVHIQGTALKLESVTNVDETISNIMASGEFVAAAVSEEQVRNYGEMGDWRDSWATLPGRTTYGEQSLHLRNSSLDDLIATHCRLCLHVTMHLSAYPLMHLSTHSPTHSFTSLTSSHKVPCS